MATLLLAPGQREPVVEYLEARAEAIDTGQQPLPEVLRFLNEQIGASRLDEADDQASHGVGADRLHIARTMATAATASMSAAFSLWCHRMVMEYLAFAPAGSAPREALLPRLAGCDLLGSTALAAAMSYHVGAVPLPVTWHESEGKIVLNGRVNWASNLFTPRFVMVTAAAHRDDGRVIVLALRGDPAAAPGLHLDPYPSLLALQATSSSSLSFRDLAVDPALLITDDFDRFIRHVRPPFLLLQSSFCWGIAYQALREARKALRPRDDSFGDELEALEAQAGQVAARVVAGLCELEPGATPVTGAPVASAPVAGAPAARTAIRSLVQLRLEAAQLATAAVALECKIVGGRGYVVNSPTARRFREAAFLPIQAPTEGQLRWELSRSA